MAALMDAHPGTFSRPEGVRNWMEYVSEDRQAAPQERRSLDTAVGMVAGAIRAAQLAGQDSPSLVAIFQQVEEIDRGSVAPDPMVLEASLNSGALSKEESLAFAKSITAYLHLSRCGYLQPDAVLVRIEEMFEATPAMTSLARDVRDAAKRIVQLQFSELMSRSEAGLAKA